MPIAYALLLAASVQPTTPQALLKEVQEHYQSLGSFSARIEHRDNTGSRPVNYTQTLRWRRGGRFELLTDRTIPPEVNFYADGRYVLTIGPDNSWRAEALAPPPDMMPGWEQEGLPILGWLQRTPTSDLYYTPPPGPLYERSFGPRTAWQGQKVCEIVITYHGVKPSASSVFVDPEKKLYIGSEGASGAVIVTDQELDPALPEDLGDSPAEENAP